MAEKKFKKGDGVEWNTPQGRTKGHVEKVVTDDTQVAGQKLTASKDDPRVIVESDSSGKKAGHNPGSLDKK
jgi:hypothetical protein